MNYQKLALLTCFVLSLPVAQPCCYAQDDFVPMFNGSDLSGWVLTNTPHETWSFKEGVLFCTGKPIGEIRTAKMYQNFIMELEWRHMVPRGNAGIFVWADDITARGVPFHRGIEVQVLENEYGNTKSHTTHGDMFPIHGATMTPINGRGGSRAFPTESRSKPSPQWNHYRIEARDGELSLAVNGKLVTQGKDCVPRKGYICLESEGGVVQYRNVRIRELPATEISDEHVAIANRGYQSQYTGLNLSGWHADAPSLWKSNNWVLAFTGSSDQSGRLTSIQNFKDENFVFDVRLKPGSGAIIDAGPNFHIDLQDSSIAKHLQAAGGWNRIEAIVEDGKRWLTINGHKVPMDEASQKSNGKFILKPTGPVDFCNLYAT